MVKISCNLLCICLPHHSSEEAIHFFFLALIRIQYMCKVSLNVGDELSRRVGGTTVI